MCDANKLILIITSYQLLLTIKVIIQNAHKSACFDMTCELTECFTVITQARENQPYITFIHRTTNLIVLNEIQTRGLNCMASKGRL